MRWVEIISVRLSRDKDIVKVQDIFRLIKTMDSGAMDPIDITLYVNNRVETDWSIHLYRDGTESPVQKSDLGLSLAESLRSFGLVNHSVWKGI